METPSSQRRLTRSQVRLGSACIHDSASKPPANAESAGSKMKAGRRVLADIASNDSPIVGLVPGTPSSSLKSTTRRRPFAPADASLGTPVGEDLLRSQVQLLLQKVETDIHKAPSLRTLCHINGYLDSPTRLAAPTPVNTPASCAQVDSSATPGTVSPPKNHPPPAESPSVQIFVDLGVSSPAIFSISETDTPSIHCTAETSENDSTIGQLTIAGPPSIVSGRDPEATHTTAPIVPEVMEAETADLFLGNQITRTLHFDSPDKSATEISMSSFSAASSENSPGRVVRELEDDETSEWSVLVNVSSPGGTHEESDLPVAEVALETEKISNTASCSVREHLQNTREESNKLELLWSDKRGGLPYSGESSANEEEAYEDCECEEAYYSYEETEEDYEGQTDGCDELCKSFRGMTVKDEGRLKGLPGYEGKHIRFLYDSDGEEIAEEEVVVNEGGGMGRSSDGVMHLKGLPTPLGKHLRFSEADESPAR